MTNLYLEIEQNDYPLKDTEFLEIDDRLYSIIQDTLNIDYSINEDQDLFNWYCQIRDKLCEDIHKKKEGLI